MKSVKYSSLQIVSPYTNDRIKISKSKSNRIFPRTFECFLDATQEYQLGASMAPLFDIIKFIYLE